MSAAVKISPIDIEPSNEDVASIRSSVLILIKDKGPNAFDDRDIERITNDDHYIRRFLAENAHDSTKTRKSILETLHWRKEKGINKVTPRDEILRLIEALPMAAFNRDLHDCKMLIVTVRKHVKADNSTDCLKKLFVYWLERMEREEYGRQITIVLDMIDATMSNVDLVFVRYMVSILANYYPWFLGKFIILDMHKAFESVWKIIQAWLPAKTKGLIHFIERNRLGEFVSPEHCPEEWGGKDKKCLNFQEEVDPRREPWMEEHTPLNHLYYVRKRQGKH